MRRVLVTGAAGLIGSATLDLLAAQGIPVTALVLADPSGPLPAEPQSMIPVRPVSRSNRNASGDGSPCWVP